MVKIEDLLKSNEKWASEVKESQPELFANLEKGQKPKFLWIGCSDSRVPATLICGLNPGELFVHRNIGNQVHENDNSLQSVLFYSLEALGIREIIICGHSSCGGVEAALSGKLDGCLHSWLSPLSNHLKECKTTGLEDAVDTNIKRQVQILKSFDLLKKHSDVKIHALRFDLSQGSLKKLNLS